MTQPSAPDAPDAAVRPARRRVLRLATTALLAPSLASSPARAQTPAGTVCVVPARAGSGFDLACRLLQRGLGLIQPGEPVTVAHLPGGIGAAAYNAFATQRPAEPDTLVAFSGGTLLSLALGRFGDYDTNAVRWLGSLGMDYGMVAVRRDAPYGDLRALVAALRREPEKMVFGGSGTVGSQDWMKAALVARLAGLKPAGFQYVGFEGGGEALTALRSGYVNVVPGEVSEATAVMRQGQIRLLTVMTEARVPGVLAGVPTAREQGYDIIWPNVRGFYMGPRVPEAAFRRWLERMRQLHASAAFLKMRTEAGLFPFDRIGVNLHRYVDTALLDYARLASEFGLAPR